MDALITETLEMKGRVSLTYGASGLILFYRVPVGHPGVKVGDELLIVRSDGWMRRVVASDIREHGPDGRSCFVAGLAKDDVPPGSVIRWSEQGGSLTDKEVLAAS